MRSIVLFSVAIISGALLAASGCGGTTTTGPGGGGSGGSGGSGATGGSTTSTGGSPCTPTTELCDGLDNDCNGKVDEGCACIDGDTQPCYNGDPATQGIGACKDGMQTCDEQGQWSDCMGAVTPQNESCNTLDDDCNGTADDMGVASCGVGACAATVTVCEDGQLNQCMPGTPSAELCDGIDNNCNQLTDETFPNQGAACDSGLLGECQAGNMQCLTEGGTTAPVCVPNKMPGMELCNSLDDDCDGTVDNNIPGTGGACSTGLLGTCDPGTISCQNGVVDCYANNPPTPEVCDAFDNDCNGLTDDLPGAGQACSTGLLGACANGIMQCSGANFGCVQQVQAQATDTCGDNIDNDCDGTVDEGCLFQFSGPMTNVPIASLTGWQQCYLDSYNNNVTPLTTILAACPKQKLLLGCRVTGSNTLMVAANAPRADVIFDTGTTNTPHNANGSGWYYNNSYSWGFALQGDVLSRNSCDTGSTNPDKRLCWHTGTGNINTGWRCGASTGLNFVTTHERLIFQAD